MHFISLFFVFIMAAVIIFPPLSVAYFNRYPLPQKAKKRADKRQILRNSSIRAKTHAAQYKPIFRTPKMPTLLCSKLLTNF